MTDETAVSLEEGRAQVMHRALGRCEVQVAVACKVNEPEHHHRQSRRTHDHRPSNGIAACRACHTFIHSHPEDSYGRGWIVFTWATPAETPAVLHPRGEADAITVNLTHGGTYT